MLLPLDHQVNIVPLRISNPNLGNIIGFKTMKYADSSNPRVAPIALKQLDIVGELLFMNDKLRL